MAALSGPSKPAVPEPAGVDEDRVANSAKPAGTSKPDPNQKVC